MAARVLTRCGGRTLLDFASGTKKGSNRFYWTLSRHTAASLTVNNIFNPFHAFYFCCLWGSQLYREVRNRLKVSADVSYYNSDLTSLTQFSWHQQQTRCLPLHTCSQVLFCCHFLLCAGWTSCCPPGPPCAVLPELWSCSQGAGVTCGPRCGQRYTRALYTHVSSNCFESTCGCWTLFGVMFGQRGFWSKRTTCTAVQKRRSCTSCCCSTRTGERDCSAHTSSRF